jgi:hypothetical protein
MVTLFINRVPLCVLSEEKDKGKFASIFWTLFNCGGILGSIIALILNLENSTGGVSTGTHVAFVVVMSIGVVFSLTLTQLM